MSKQFQESVRAIHSRFGLLEEENEARDKDIKREFGIVYDQMDSRFACVGADIDKF